MIGISVLMQIESRQQDILNDDAAENVPTLMLQTQEHFKIPTAVKLCM